MPSSCGFFMRTSSLAKMTTAPFDGLSSSSSSSIIYKEVDALCRRTTLLARFCEEKNDDK
jgi:hypothetical protein